jgi:hypothetical protein
MNRKLLYFLTATLLTACGITNPPTPMEITDKKGVTMLLVPAGEFTPEG